MYLFVIFYLLDASVYNTQIVNGAQNSILHKLLPIIQIRVIYY